VRLVTICNEEDELVRKESVGLAMMALVAEIRRRIDAGETEISMALTVSVKEG
jgi:hypothetical protein